MLRFVKIGVYAFLICGIVTLLGALLMEGSGSARPISLSQIASGNSALLKKAPGAKAVESAGKAVDSAGKAAGVDAAAVVNGKSTPVPAKAASNPGGATAQPGGDQTTDAQAPASGEPVTTTVGAGSGAPTDAGSPAVQAGEPVTTTTSTSDTATSGQTIITTPTAAPSVGGGTSGATTKGLTLSALAVEDPAPPSATYTAKDNTKLIAVQLVIGNQTDQAITVNPTNAILVDAEGFTYRAVLGAHDDQVDVMDLALGEKVKGWVAFATPQTAKPAYLKYQVQTGSYLQVPLAPK